MNTIFRRSNSTEDKSSIASLARKLQVTLISLLVIMLYFTILHPLLKPSMTDAVVEVAIAAVIVLSLVTILLMIIVTIVIIIILALRSRTRARLGEWGKKLINQVTAALVLALLITAVTLGTQWTAYTPAILGTDGEVLPNSIASMEKVLLGDSKQWITIRGENKNNPILLFLAGGPGGSQLAATRIELKGLEKHFVVVNWDQPGAGKSANAVATKDITPERYISDAHDLTEYLCKRFNKEKIYVLGESWGSVLGVWLVQRYPEKFNAFIGTGQMISFKETEIMNYELAIKMAQEEGDTKKVNKLRAQGAPPYYGKNTVFKIQAYTGYLGNIMAHNPDISRPGYNTLAEIGGPEYGLYDKVNYLLGLAKTFNDVYQQLYDFDLRKQSVKIEVPVYFLEGRHDINAPTSLVEEYYQMLQAPEKQLIWFEHSGHSPWRNERERFVNTIVDLVLQKN